MQRVVRPAETRAIGNGPRRRARRARAGSVLAIAASLLLVLSFASPPAAGQSPPPPEAALSGVRAVTAGDDHTCVLLQSSGVRCTGDNGDRQVGDGGLDDRLFAVPVTSLSGVTQLAAGYDHTCARLASGQARCWGDNEHAQLGDGTTSDRGAPVTVLGPSGVAALGNVAAIAPGAEHTCARLANGQARCWGDNRSHQLGDAGVSGTGSALPVAVRAVSGPGNLTGVAQVVAGAEHSCARLTNGRVVCWGESEVGQVGDGTATDRARPRTVRNPAGTGPLTGVVELSAMNDHTCARLENGQMRCWGENSETQLGDGSNVNRFRPVAVRNPSGRANLGGVSQISTGGVHTCARLTNGQARCWGENGAGRLGDGTTTDSSLPVPVRNQAGSANLTGIEKVDAGDSHSCARVSANLALCWGRNHQGQLGDGTIVDRLLPAPVQTA